MCGSGGEGKRKNSDVLSLWLAGCVWLGMCEKSNLITELQPKWTNCGKGLKLKRKRERLASSSASSTFVVVVAWNCTGDIGALVFCACLRPTCECEWCHLMSLCGCFVIILKVRKALATLGPTKEAQEKFKKGLTDAVEAAKRTFKSIGQDPLVFELSEEGYDKTAAEKGLYHNLLTIVVFYSAPFVL